MMDLGTLQAKIKVDASGALKPIQETKKEVDNLASNSEKATSRAKSAFQNFASTLAALGVADIIHTIGDAIVDLGKEAINNLDEMKKFEKGMGFAGYSDAEIKQAKQDVEDYANSTVYNLDDVAHTTQALAANGVEDYQELTEAAGNLNAVVGGTPDTFKSVTMALTQINGAGKLTTENWNQITDAIPGASGALQEALLKNGAYAGDFREAMARGEITAEEFNQALMDVGYTDAAAEAATATDTFSGAMENLKSTVVTQLSEIFSDTGLEGGVIDLINSLSDFISNNQETITNFFTTLGDVIGALTPIFVTFVTAWVVFNGLLMIQGLIAGVVTVFGELAAAFQLVAEGATIAEAAQALLNGTMLANPIVLIIALIAGLVAGFVYLWNTSEGFRNFWLNLWETVKNAASTAKEWISDKLTAIGNFFTQTLPQSFENFKAKLAEMKANAKAKLDELKNNAKTFASNFANNVKQGAINAKDRLISTLKSIPSKVIEIGKNIIQGMINGIKSKAQDMIDSVTGAVNNAIDGAKRLLGIASPSKLFKKFGKFTMEGFSIGIDDNVAVATSSMRNAAQDISDAFNASAQANSYNGYKAFTNSRKDDYKASNKQNNNQPSNITINNYSPKALSERESAREFKRSMRQMALAN